MPTALIPVFEFLSMDDASKAKAKAFIEKVDHAVKSFGIIVRDNKPIEWLQKVLPTYLYDKLAIIGYKTAAEDFLGPAEWHRWFKTVNLDFMGFIFFDHEHALKTILDSGKPLADSSVKEYGRFLEVLNKASPCISAIIHYPGVVRNESEAYQRLYGGLSLAAANAGALVCDNSLGYAVETKGSVLGWFPNQNAASTSIRAALVGAHGPQVIAPMLYTRDAMTNGWPMSELPRLEKTYADLGYSPVMVHLGWGRLLELGDEWVRVFEGQS